MTMVYTVSGLKGLTEMSNDYKENSLERLDRYEGACNVMATYIGLLRTERLDERKKETPDHDKIQALKKQMDTIIDERHAMLPNSEELIAKALYVYAPIVKAMMFSKQ